MPRPDAPSLPASPVGPGVWLYWWNRDRDPTQYLVTAAGNQYRLDRESLWHDLSPGGRWLASTHASTTTLHRLAEPAVPDRTIAGRAVAWSADARFVATEPRLGPDAPVDGPGPLTIIDLGAPPQPPSTIDADGKVVTLLDNGDPVLAREGLGLVVVDRFTGAQRRSIPMEDAGAAVAVPIVHARLALQHWAGDLIVVDTNAITERHCPLPPAGQDKSWELQGALPDGSVLLQRSSLAGAESLHRYDPATGDLRPLTDLTPLLSG